MDGKKRIARLRNAEKWKKLGSAIPLRKAERQKIEAAKLEKIREKIRDDLVAKAIPIPKIGDAKPARKGYIFAEDRWGDVVEVPKSPFKSSMAYIGDPCPTNKTGILALMMDYKLARTLRGL